MEEMFHSKCQLVQVGLLCVTFHVVCLPSGPLKKRSLLTFPTREWEPFPFCNLWSKLLVVHRVSRQFACIVQHLDLSLSVVFLQWLYPLSFHTYAFLQILSCSGGGDITHFPVAFQPLFTLKLFKLTLDCTARHNVPGMDIELRMRFSNTIFVSASVNPALKVLPVSIMKWGNWLLNQKYGDTLYNPMRSSMATARWYLLPYFCIYI